MRRNKEYEEWTTIHEGAKLACQMGLSAFFEAVEREYIDLQWLSDPRNYGPDMEDLQESNE